MKKKFMAVLMIFAIIILAAAPALAKTYKWKLAHTRSPEAQIHKDLTEFAEKVQKETNGEVQISVMAGGQLGDWSVVQERVSMGNVEMTCGPMSTAVDKRLEMTNLCAAVTDWDKVATSYISGTPFIDQIANWVGEQNLTILTTYPFYLGGLGFTKEIDDPANPALKRGLKLRIPSMVTFRHMVEGLGYIPTPIAWGDTFTAMQTGVVDGVAGTGAEGCCTNGFVDVMKSYLPINTHFELWYMMVNTDKFKKLPEEYQNVIIKLAKEIEQKRLVEGPKETAKWEQVMRDKGVVVYNLTDEQIQAYHEIIRNATWPATRELVGADVFDAAVKYLQ
ncbi:MAG TPA: TRAP transporter substrate-binding protein DctP [Candidatus Caccocola faecigallinarum]|nr:TRAP transporter substrate-binding protein DctP [Candidatus Caccocola faecigallinarum]